MRELRTICGELKAARSEEEITSEQMLALTKLLENKNGQGSLSVRLLSSLNFRLSTHNSLLRLSIQLPHIEMQPLVVDNLSLNVLASVNPPITALIDYPSILQQNEGQQTSIFRQALHNNFFMNNFRPDVPAQQAPNRTEPTARDYSQRSAGG